MSITEHTQKFGFVVSVLVFSHTWPIHKCGNIPRAIPSLMLRVTLAVLGMKSGLLNAKSAPRLLIVYSPESFFFCFVLGQYLAVLSLLLELCIWVV